MNTTLKIVLGLAVLAAYGCASRQGGGMASSEGFKIVTPVMGMSLKQGETKAVKVSLDRGKYFKQDVRLTIRASEGLTVSPSEVVVRASEKPDVPLQVTAPRDAAIGEYRLYITGTPETGTATSTEIKTKVIALGPTPEHAQQQRQ
jgi:uncharacterized membrane protein